MQYNLPAFYVLEKHEIGAEFQEPPVQIFII